MTSSFFRSLLRDLCLPILLLLFADWARAADPGLPAPGRKLDEFLDSLRVEQNWIAKYRVDWRTGAASGPLETSEGSHSHCSVFAAAVAERLGIYLLRPPEHPQKLLANAQADWLTGPGGAQGWREIADGAEAQRLANGGELVVAVYKALHEDVSGHIAIVRADEKAPGLVAREGPQITQAGVENFASTTLENGFSHHPGAFARHRIRFFAHAVDPARFTAAGH